MWLPEQKLDIFAYKLKFILLSQLIATLNNYACLLPPLANVNWSAFPEYFYRPCKSMTGEMVPMEGSNLAVGSDMAPTISACLSRPCGGTLALCGYMWKSYIATVNSTICVILLLWLGFYHHQSHPLTPPAHPVIYDGPILMNSMKQIIKNLWKSAIVNLPG